MVPVILGISPAFSTLLAETVPLSELKLSDGTTYKDVEVTRTTPNGIRIVYEVKAVEIAYEDLPRDVRQRLYPERAGQRLEDLAQKIGPLAEASDLWSHVILPARGIQTLREVVTHVEHHEKVLKEWEVSGHPLSSSTGLSALFAGKQGCGQLEAAQAIAGSLELDLYRVDLSAVVSKYIGESDQHLGRIFDAAAEEEALLLFENSDLLFEGGGSDEEKNDRPSLVHIASYLFERLGGHDKPVILLTHGPLLDDRDLRRVRFVVQFPFPDVQDRERFWQVVFPNDLALGDLKFDRLAQLNIDFDTIHTIAFNAATTAASKEEPISMTHILNATRPEYRKLGRTLTEAELRDW